LKLIFKMSTNRCSRFFRYAANGIVCALILCVIVSQVYMAVSRVSLDVSSAEVAPVSEYVELEIGNFSGTRACILLNGEKYSDVRPGKMRITINDADVIELYNGTSGSIEVTIAASSPHTEVVAEEKSIECKGGITYICRCVRRLS